MSTIYGYARKSSDGERDDTPHDLDFGIDEYSG
jgi:hypothetical protein